MTTKPAPPNVAVTNVGSFIANLTLAQVKTLDCSAPLTAHVQQDIHTPTRIATLQEVLELIHCYGDEDAKISLETKLDPLAPNESLPVENYITDIIPILQEYNVLHRTSIQSFDWRTLIGIRERFPDTHPPLIALLDETTVLPDDGRGTNRAGEYPWLGGINLAEDFDGDWIAAASSIGCAGLSPVHGFPSNLTVNTPGYSPFSTRDVVERAHALWMLVVPWTVNYEVTVDKLIDDGVDAVISNYPERVLGLRDGGG